MRRPLVPVTAALVVLAALSCPENARAQQAPSLDLRGFQPSTDPESGIYYEPARSPETLQANGALFFSYAYRPLTLRGSDGEVARDVVSHQLSGDVVANIGLGGIAALGVGVPFALYQTGDELDAPAQQSIGTLSLPAQALGDVSLVGKLTIVPPTGGDLGGFAMALHQRVTLPTGDPQSLLGEGFVSSETRLLLEYSYVALSAHGAVGAKFRDHHDFGCGTTPSTEDATCPTRFGHQLPWGVGLSFKPQAVGIDKDGRWTWFVESYGYLPLAPHAPFSSEALSQAQLVAGARVKLVEDVSLLAGVETALLGGIGTAPFRGTLALSWAPRKHDDDDDGVPNDVDQCPEDMPEDLDGIEDGDGCPEWDNDEDGVPDESDQCDGKLEDEDGYLDDDGCPDPDNDGDGILDEDDACRDQKGVESADPAKRGCPDLDEDRDGVELPADQCPTEREDVDGHLDGDGCPDPDNDGDGIADVDDACDDDKGPASAEHPEENGCPDKDGDGVADVKDACVEVAGSRDKQGCPEDGADKDGAAKGGAKGGAVKGGAKGVKKGGS